MGLKLNICISSEIFEAPELYVIPLKASHSVKWPIGASCAHEIHTYTLGLSFNYFVKLA